MALLALGNFRLLNGTAAPQYDAADFFGPEFSLTSDTIKAGRILLWNPWSAAGAPDYAEPELGSSSPFVLAAGVLPLSPEAGYVLYWMATWIFGALGMLLLARHLGSPAWGGAIAARAVLPPPGFFTGHAEHMSSIYSVSFIPWIVWRLDTALDRRAWWPAVQAGVLYGLSGLGGYPQFTILIPALLIPLDHSRVVSVWEWGTLARLALGCCVSRGTADYRSALRIPWSSLALLTRYDSSGERVAIAIILAHGPGRLSFLQTRCRRARSPPSRVPISRLLNFPPNPVWPTTDVSMTSIYAGAPMTVLAFFALRRRCCRRWWLAAIAVFFFCCAVGDALPVRGWLYDFVFPTRYFRNAALFRAFPLLLLGVLAALGARDLTDTEVSGRDRLRFAVVATLLAVRSHRVFCDDMLAYGKINAGI